MKKTILLYLIFSTFLLCINGQKTLHIKNQKNYNYFDSFILDSLNIRKPNYDVIDLQIRISIWNAASGIHKVFIIEREKSGNWRGENFEFYYYNDDHHDFSKTISDKLILGKKWDSAFRTIVMRDYINLPSQKEVEKTISISNKDSTGKLIMITADGTSYTYEFLTKRRKRKFTFKNPDSYYQFNKEQHNDTKYFEMYMDLLTISKQALNLETTLKVDK